MTALDARLLDGLTDEAAFEVHRMCDEVDGWSAPPAFAEFRSRLSQWLESLDEQFPSEPAARQVAIFFIVASAARIYFAHDAWSVATANDLETVCSDETERMLVRKVIDEAIAAAAARPASSPISRVPPPPRRIGQYEILETLGAGGMGVVFKGRDLHSQNVVAIKVLRADLACDEESRERFRREARALQRLDHPGIVRQFREGVDDGRPYLVMEYVEGGSLQERAADAPLEPIVAAELLADVCDAAEYLHREGLIHRDVKPQNILLTSSGQAKLADFGLAKHLHATSMLTNTGQALGTPSYMPPEQVRGDGDMIMAASDIYAIGATLYRLVCGRPPFQAASPLITIAQILNDDPLAPRQLNPAVPEDLELICLKCLEKEPARRFQTASELGAELRRFAARQPLRTRRPNWLRQASAWYRKNQIVTVAASLIGLILLFATALSMKYSRDSDQAARMLRRQLVANQVAAGWQHMQSGDPAAAAVLFTSALRTDSQAPLTLEIHRRRAAHALNSTPQPLHAWTHDSTIISSRFSPDGAKVLTAGTDGTVNIWDAISGRNLTGVQIRSSPVTFASFSPDGRLFAVAAGNSVSIWDGETQRLVCPPLQHDMIVNHFAFHPDGRLLVTAAGDSGSAAKTVFRELPRVAPGVDRQRIPEFIAPTGYSQQWDIATGQPLGPRMTQTGGATWVEYGRDGLLIVSASPTASTLASANGRDHVRIWDARTSLARDPPLTHRHEIGFASLDPLDSRILTASNAFPYNQNPTSAWLWKTHSDIPEAIELSHRGSVTLARFTPDGSRIVTATRDGGVRVWDGRDGTPLTNGAEHGDAINDLSVSSSGRRFATAARDGTVAVWDTANGERASPLLHLASAVVAVNFSPDERRLLTVTLSGEACLWDLQLPADERARLVHSSPVGRLQFTADNRLQSWTLNEGNLVTISNTRHDVRPRRTLRGTSRWSLDDNSLISTPVSNDNLPRAVAWSACGRRELRTDGYRGGGNKAVAVDLIESDEHGFSATRHSLPSEIAVGAIATSKPLAVLGLNNGQVWQLRAADAAPELILDTDREILQTAISRDGRFAAAVSRARNRKGSWTLHFFGPDRGIRSVDHESPVRTLQFSPDDRWVVVNAGAGGLETGGAIRLWNPVTAKAVGMTLQHPRLVHAIAFSPDFGHIATACDDGLVRFWRLADSRPSDVIIRLPRAVNSVAFAPDGRRLATACDDGGVRIWDTLTGEAVSPPWRHELAALHVAFDSSGDRLASASLDETVRIWNTAPSSGSPAEILLRAEIASARRLSSAGTLRPLTLAEYRGVWRRKAAAQ